MPEADYSYTHEGLDRLVQSFRQEFAASFGTEPLQTQVRTTYREKRGTRQRVRQHHLKLRDRSLAYTEHPVDQFEAEQLYTSCFEALRLAPWVLDQLATAVLRYSLQSLEFPQHDLPLNELYATYRKVEDLHMRMALYPHGQRLQMKRHGYSAVLWTYHPMQLWEEQGTTRRVFFTDLLAAGKQIAWLTTVLEERQARYLQTLLGA